MQAIEGLQLYCRTVSSSSLMGMMGLSSPRTTMRQFREHMISFCIRLLEAYIMLNSVLERIRRYIIDNVQNSNLDEPFLRLEDTLARFGR